MLIQRGLSAFACAAFITFAMPALAVEPSTPHEKKFEAALTDAKVALMANPEGVTQKSQGLLALAKEASDPKTQAMEVATAQWLQAEALTRTGKGENALPLLNHAIESISAYPKVKLHGDLIRSRGDAYLNLGKVLLALPDLQAAHDVYRQAGEPRGQAMTLMDIGTIYQNAGDFPKVLQYYSQAEEIFAADPNLEFSMNNNKAIAYRSMGNFSSSLKSFNKAKNVAFELNSKFLEVITLENISQTQIVLNKISDAEKKQDASSIFRFGLAREFFQGFTNEARCNLHLELLYGDEPHHIVEALFKAFARAVDAARRHDPRIAGQLPSTKGKL